MSNDHLRVCVVDWAEALERADPFDGNPFLEVRCSTTPQPSEQDLSECDVVLAACSEHILASPLIRRRVARLSTRVRVMAVVPRPGPEAGLRAVRAGFSGVVAREVSAHALYRAVEAAARGEIVLPRDAVAAVVHWIARFAPRRRIAGVALTPRQREIVDLIARGSTDREIAALLQISEDTAHKHVQNALRRANARRRSELVALTSRAPQPRPLY